MVDCLAIMQLTTHLDLDEAVLGALVDPEAVKAVAFDPENKNPAPINATHPDWGDLSLASGYPSLILFFAQVQKSGMFGDVSGIVHGYVLKLKSAMEEEGLASLSLFGGVAGIAFALEQASDGGKRYQRMLQGLHEFMLDGLVLKRNEGPVSAAFYDPIQGICGIGRYVVEHLDFPRFKETAEEIVRAVVELSKPFSFRGREVHGWFLSEEDRLNRNNRGRNPNGNFNLGLAHGIVGALAFLSIALLKGVEVEGQREAIGRIAEWVKGRAFRGKGVVWPYSVSWEEEFGLVERGRESARDAWCYGAPGVTRALFLAGKALGDAGLRAFAMGAFQDVFLRSREEWRLPGPTLCHGISGLLLTAHMMGLPDRVGELKEILGTFRRGIYGFRDVESCLGGAFCEVDKAGFLEGATGVWLTLLTVDGAIDDKWSLPLLMND